MGAGHALPAGFVTRMTAEGPGAIGVLRIWGASAFEVADRVFRPRIGRRPLRDSAPGELRLGWFGGDEVVAVLIQEESTGLMEVEIQGHGSELLLDALIELLAKHRIASASRDDYIKAHGIRRLERLAIEKLGQSTTTRSANVLYRQSRGAMRANLEKIGVAIDANDIEAAALELDDLLRTADFGTRLASGFRVALAGPPNVGKSTLINALAGFERSVVSPTPGTTRDAVDVAVVLDGWPIVLTDTAGLRAATADPLEAEGIRIAREEHRRADLVLKMTECSSEPDLCEYDARTIDVRTKADLATDEEIERAARMASGPVIVSAQAGDGLEGLMERIVQTVAPIELAERSAVVFDESLARSLREVRLNLSNGEIDSARSDLWHWLE
ncbi:hypothetical protein GC170_01465 [bacterium]|nr:hypothetical protein [bacterium]